MIYGGVLTYNYDEENENGEVQKKKLELSFNALTLVEYYNYVGRDFMADFSEICFKSKDGIKGISPELQAKIDNGEDLTYNDLSQQDFSALQSVDYSAHLRFFINLIAAMIATHEYPTKRDFSEIISDIPLFALYDEDFMRDLMEFVAFGLKKNKGQLQKFGQRRTKQN